MFIYYGLHLRGVINGKSRLSAMFLVFIRSKSVVFHVFHSHHYGSYDFGSRIILVYGPYLWGGLGFQIFKDVSLPFLPP